MALSFFVLSYPPNPPHPDPPLTFFSTPKLRLTHFLITQEVKLSETAAERELNDSLAEIYSIIITLDGLEKAYIKDSIPEAEYTELCSRLLKQYKSNLSDENVAREFVDLETFKRAWDVRCSPPSPFRWAIAPPTRLPTISSPKTC